MHIAIDDTYGPNSANDSRYITGNRRTSVAVVFKDSQIDSIRNNMHECISYIRNDLSIEIDEFHFTDIYNRRGPWSKLNDMTNIRIFQAFAHIYNQYKWPIHIQTIDERTLSDHNIKTLIGKVDTLDLSDRQQLSLAFLLIKIKNLYINSNEPLNLFVDEGIGKAGKLFGNMWFNDWPQNFNCSYESSAREPLLQIADFLAFSINRMTYLLTKNNRTKFDLEVLSLLSSMDMNSPDLIKKEIVSNFTIEDVDHIHDDDRKAKGLKCL